MVVITAKSIDPAYTELVNGPLYIPVLGNLFPRLWGDRRVVTRKRFLVHTDAGSFEVSEKKFAALHNGDRYDPAQA